MPCIVACDFPAADYNPWDLMQFDIDNWKVNDVYVKWMVCWSVPYIYICIWWMLFSVYLDYTYVYMPIFNVNGNHSGGRPFPHRKRWWMLRFIVTLHQIRLTCPTGHDPVAMVCCFLRGERLKQVRRWSEEFDPVGDACNDQTVCMYWE